MPRVLIEVRRQYTREQETVLIDKVFEGLRDAFALPESDRNLRLVVHEPHRFSCPPDRAQPELYPCFGEIHAFTAAGEGPAAGQPPL